MYSIKVTARRMATYPRSMVYDRSSLADAVQAARAYRARIGCANTLSVSVVDGNGVRVWASAYHASTGLWLDLPC